MADPWRTSAPRWKLAEKSTGPFPVIFQAALGSADTILDLWDAGGPLPLFSGSSPGTLEVFGASDVGAQVEVTGLDAAGNFLEEVVTVAAAAGTPTASDWRAPVAHMRLLGASGVRTGAGGDITARVGGSVISGKILAGFAESHTGCREVPAGQKYVVHRVTAALIREAGQGQTTAAVTVALMESRPNRLVRPLLKFRAGTSVVTEFEFGPGSFPFVAAQTDAATPIVSGEFLYDRVDL